MKGHKRILLPASLYDVAAIETWLAGQASQGWLLASMGTIMARLERGGPVECQYRLEPVDGAELIRDQDLRDYYTAAGWEFVCYSRNKLFRIWRSTRLDPLALHSDPEVEERAYRCLSRILLRNGVFVACWALGMLCQIYPWPSALQGQWEKIVCAVPGTGPLIVLLLLGYFLFLSLSSVRAIRRLRKSLRLGLPLDHTKQHGVWWTWSRRTVLALTVALLGFGSLYSSSQSLPIQDGVPPVLLSTELGAEPGDHGGFIVINRNLLSKRTMWAAEFSGDSIEDQIMETKYFSLRLPFLAEPLLKELTEGWIPEDTRVLEIPQFEGAYYMERKTWQYLALRRDGQVLYVAAEVPHDLRAHIDEYAAALEKGV